MALPASIQPLRPVEDGPDATSADLVRVIRRFGQSVRLRRGQLLFREGERADTVYLLESGNFRSTIIFLDGRRQIIGFYGPGDLIGVSSGDIYDTSAEAITTAQATGVRRQWLNSLLHDQSQLAANLTSLIVRNVETARLHTLLLGRMTARERVGSFLLERTHGKTGVVELPMSSRDIADYLGLTIETVSRVLSKLEREGAIRKELRSRRIEVVNPDQLQSGIALGLRVRHLDGV